MTFSLALILCFLHVDKEYALECFYYNEIPTLPSHLTLEIVTYSYNLPS